MSGKPKNCGRADCTGRHSGHKVLSGNPICPTYIEAHRRLDRLGTRKRRGLIHFETTCPYPCGNKVEGWAKPDSQRRKKYCCKEHKEAHLDKMRALREGRQPMRRRKTWTSGLDEYVKYLVEQDRRRNGN